MSEEAVEGLRKGIKFCKVVRNDEKVDVEMADDGVEICGCDRCAFRKDAEKSFRGSDDEDFDGESLSSDGGEGNVEMLLWREQLGDLDEYESTSGSDNESGSGEGGEGDDDVN